MHRVFGIVLFVVGTAFILLGGYLLYTGYTANLFDWQDMLFVAGICLFGYLLVMAGYRMARGDSF